MSLEQRSWDYLHNRRAGITVLISEITASGSFDFPVQLLRLRDRMMVYLETIILSWINMLYFFPRSFPPRKCLVGVRLFYIGFPESLPLDLAPRNIRSSLWHI